MAEARTEYRGKSFYSAKLCSSIKRDVGASSWVWSRYKASIQSQIHIEKYCSVFKSVMFICRAILEDWNAFSLDVDGVVMGSTCWGFRKGSRQQQVKWKRKFITKGFPAYMGKKVDEDKICNFGEKNNLLLDQNYASHLKRACSLERL